MVNKVILLGNLGQDPNLRHTESGVPVATFSLATNESYIDKEGNKQKRTEWHNIVVWRKLAEVAEQYLKKGSLIYVEGKITSRSYQAQDGSTRYITEIVANNFQMMPKIGGNAAPLPPEEQAPAQISSNVEAMDSKSNLSDSSEKSTSDIATSETEPSDDLPF